MYHVAPTKRKKTPLRRKLYWWWHKRYWAVMKHVRYRDWLYEQIDNHPEPDPQEVEEFLVLDSEIWRKRGNRVNTSASEIPLPEGIKSHWHSSDYNQYDAYLDWETLRRFRKLVVAAEHEERQRKRASGEFWLKCFTAIAAATGAGIAIYNLFHKAP